MVPEIEILTRVAHTLTGSWSDAEDVVQETLVRAWRAVDRFDGAHPRAWLLTILRNTHLNMIRRRRPDLLWDGTPRDGQRSAFASSYQPGPEQHTMDQTLEADVELALTSLDPRFRRVVLLVDVDQLTYAETAEVLGIPVGTVMSRLHRGRDRLRGRLREIGQEGATR